VARAVLVESRRRVLRANATHTGGAQSSDHGAPVAHGFDAAPYHQAAERALADVHAANDRILQHALPATHPAFGVALDAVLAELGRRGVRTLLVEGGPTIAAALLEAGLVDEVVGYVRAAVLGAGRPLLDLGGVTTIADLRPFRLEGADVVGDDVRFSLGSQRYFETILWPRLRALGAATPPPAAGTRWWRRRGPSPRALEQLIADLERHP